MKNIKKETPLELPEVSYDPIKNIEMEGALFRNMRHRHRSPFIRIVIIFVSLIIFIIPGLSVFYILMNFLRESRSSNGFSFFVIIAGIFISLLYTACGIKAIYSNIFYRHQK